MKNIEMKNKEISNLLETRKSINNMTLTTESTRRLSANTRELVLATGFDTYTVNAIY